MCLVTLCCSSARFCLPPIAIPIKEHLEAASASDLEVGPMSTVDMQTQNIFHLFVALQTLRPRQLQVLRTATKHAAQFNSWHVVEGHQARKN